LIEGFGAVLLIALLLWSVAEWFSVASPSAQIFRDLAQIGAALFVAFAIATAGASAFSGGNIKDHINWVGVTCGLGVAGFLAICSSVALAAYRDAGHAGWLDILGLSWVVSGLGFLGLFVALLPYATFHWARNR
jgi:hypothetical protein